VPAQQTKGALLRQIEVLRVFQSRHAHEPAIDQLRDELGLQDRPFGFALEHGVSVHVAETL